MSTGFFEDTKRLPSRGLLYSNDMCPTGEVTVRALTTGDEGMLQGATADNIDTLINKMVQGCITGGWNAPIGRMTIADRMFTLFRTRIVTHGGEYHFTQTCPKCEAVSDYAIDLNKMPVTYLQDDVAEPFYIDLPVCKKRIGWRLLRVDDENEAHVYRRKMKQKGIHGDQSMAFQFARRISSIDGDEDFPFEKLIKFAKEMHSHDRRVWEKNIEHYSIGIETELEVTCRSCGLNHIVEMPVNDDFFHPSLDQRPELSTILAGSINVAYDPDEDVLRDYLSNAGTDEGKDGKPVRGVDGKTGAGAGKSSPAPGRIDGSGGSQGKQAEHSEGNVKTVAPTVQQAPALTNPAQDAIFKKE